MKLTKPVLAGALALACLPAAAHPQAGPHVHGFMAGFIHPFTGIDHLLAMLGVGIWSARQSNGRALPLTFILMMLLGVLSGVAGLTIPGLETGIALTVALVGVLIAAAVRLPTGAGMALVGVFAVLHGNAHGHELPEAASALGLLTASALLVYAGRTLGRISPALLTKVSGAVIALAGVYMITVA